MVMRDPSIIGMRPKKQSGNQAENAHFLGCMRRFLETRHILWWKGHGSRSQTKCFASTLSYEGNISGDKDIQNYLKKLKGRKKMPEGSLIESLN